MYILYTFQGKRFAVGPYRDNKQIQDNYKDISGYEGIEMVGISPILPSGTTLIPG